MQKSIILLLSLPLAALVIVVSCIGLTTAGFYSAETLNWQAQSTGQDLIDLFLITPCLVITSVLAYRNNRAATAAWGEVALYLTYTFVLYCFDVHFNRLFLLYCLCLGLSFYSAVYFLFAHKPGRLSLRSNTAARVTGIYFIGISVLFYFLWLAEIIPSVMQHTVPESVTDTGLFTNGVHVLDLAIVLPGIFISGVFLLKQMQTGFIVALLFLHFLP